MVHRSSLIASAEVVVTRKESGEWQVGELGVGGWDQEMRENSCSSLGKLWFDPQFRFGVITSNVLSQPSLKHASQRENQCFVGLLFAVSLSIRPTRQSMLVK